MKLLSKKSNKRHTSKSDRIASIVGDSFAVHKDERSLMAAMIDELSKGTRWRKDALGMHPRLLSRLLRWQAAEMIIKRLNK